MRLEYRRFLPFLLMVFSYNVTLGLIPPAIPALQSGLRLSKAGVGLVNTAFGIARLVGDVPAGLLAERWPNSRLLTLGFGLVMAGSLLCGVAQGLLALLLGRALVGFGLAFSTIAALALLLRLAPPWRLGIASNGYQSTASLSLGAASFAGGYLASGAGWRSVFLAGMVAAGLSLSAGLAAARRAAAGLRTARGEPATQSPAERPALSKRRNQIAAAYVAAAVVAAVWGGILVTLLPLIGADVVGVDSRGIGLAMALGFVVEAIVLLPVGWAVDRFGGPRLLRWGLLTLAGGVAVLVTAKSWSSFATATVVITASFSIWMIPVVLLTSAGLNRGRFIGLYRLAVDAGFAVGPVSFAGLAEQGGYGAAGLAAILVLLGSLVLIVWAHPGAIARGGTSHILS